ncbi:hypothetical protein A3D76_03670 [Candidatus Roizmanbacteria bacterium RIFCSPHIGHO2_02_FULL_37_9b]|nr:MAG: hypothetical protein A3D76_03670 [Candidatus Roizmanbacteria bacterium RIFCSPHIGHO2_02_FULL_37_9b]
MKNFIKSNWFIIIIFTLSFILRFWKIPELFFFDIDEEYQSLLALSIIKDFHPIWIGLSAANTGFYIGPGLVYLHALLLWIGKLDPVILGYSASVIAMITLITLYFVTKNLLDKKAGLIATSVYSFLPFVLIYDRRFWNSTLVPLISILIFYGLIKSTKNDYWYILLALLLGISFHIHASLLLYLPIIIITSIKRLFEVKRRPRPFIFLVSLVIFFVIYSPLIVYDFVHNFDNLKTPLRLLQTKSVGAKFNSYYLLGFIPLFSLFLAKYLKKINTGILLILFVIYVVVAFTTVLGWKTDSGLLAKKSLIKKSLQLVGKKSFRMDTSEKYLYFGGWRYLFEAYGKKPANSQADEMFGWIYQQDISNKKPDLKVIVTGKNKFKKREKDQVISSGIYKAIIRKNE